MDLSVINSQNALTSTWEDTGFENNSTSLQFAIFLSPEQPWVIHLPPPSLSPSSTLTIFIQFSATPLDQASVDMSIFRPSPPLEAGCEHQSPLLTSISSTSDHQLLHTFSSHSIPVHLTLTLTLPYCSSIPEPLATKFCPLASPFPVLPQTTSTAPRQRD